MLISPLANISRIMPIFDEQRIRFVGDGVVVFFQKYLDFKVQTIFLKASW